MTAPQSLAIDDGVLFPENDECFEITLRSRIDEIAACLERAQRAFAVIRSEGRVTTSLAVALHIAVDDLHFDVAEMASVFAPWVEVPQ